MVHGLIVIVAGNPDIGDVLVLIGHGIRQVHVGRFGAVGGLKIDVVGDGAGFLAPSARAVPVVPSVRPRARARRRILRIRFSLKQDG